MKFSYYLRDRLVLIISYLLLNVMLLLLFLAFKIPMSLTIVILMLLFMFLVSNILFDYFRKQKFYNDLIGNIERLDKSYLVCETINKPNFYEGELLCHALYEINKSMCENIGDLKRQVNDFKDYIELWIHEVKIPLSSITLIMHNHKDSFNKKIEEQVRKLEDNVEQVLYYVRAENAEKDFLINKVDLKKVINSVALKNKDDLLENNIIFKVEDVNNYIYTDQKWLEFILNQIINNSIKYKRDIDDSYINIKTYKKEDKIILEILDNGIGIPKRDITKVFDKTYTGSNGRIKAKSTGMGLFIVSSLCNKLGHKIEIESIENEYTKVLIIISNNEFYDCLK